MLHEFSRIELMFNSDSMARLYNAKVLVFGVGGVGGIAIESMARSGISHFEIYDDDKISITNINRQLVATHSNIGKYKVDAIKERILDINPNAEVITHKEFFLPENADSIDYASFDYVVDCIDTIASKIELAKRCKASKTRLISAMGAGNKLDPSAFRVADLAETRYDRLAKVLRKELKRRGIVHLKVVYSEEQSNRLDNIERGEFEAESSKHTKTVTPASVSFVPGAMGFILAGEVVKDIAFDNYFLVD